MDQLPRLGKRELICLLLFTCNYVVSVWRGFLFLWVLGMGYVFIVALPEPSIFFYSAFIWENMTMMDTLEIIASSDLEIGLLCKLNDKMKDYE